MLARLKSSWIAIVAAIAAVAGLLGNLDKIATMAAQMLKPWLQVEATFEIVLDPKAARPLVLAIAERDRVLDTQRIVPGTPASFSVPINARYTVVWQGPGYKPGTVNDILAPPQTSRWNLRITAKDDGQDALSLRAAEESSDRQTAPAPAALLLASTPPVAGAGGAMAAEVDRALAVIGLFEVGTTECSRSVAITPVGIVFGCIGFGLPGPASVLVKGLDADDPAILERALGDLAPLVRELASRTRVIARDLETLAPDTRQRLTERLRLLAASPEFRLRHQQLALDWYRRALTVAASFDLASERGVLLVLDRLVQQGPGWANRLRPAYAARVEETKPADERARIAILAALLKAQSLPGGHSAMVGRRIDTIATGRSTARGVTYDLEAIGISADRPIAGLLPRAAAVTPGASGGSDDLERKLQRLVVQQLGVDAAAAIPKARLMDDLGADDLDLVALFMAVEKEFGVEIPKDATARLTTIGEIAAWLRASGVR